LVKEVKYVPLSPKDYKHALDNFMKKKTGTAFDGKAEVGTPCRKYCGSKE
jgi:phosphate transport system substrate-binding protein